MKASLYTPQGGHRWDEFVTTSANGTFLHQRGYMDYHADRFADSSLIIEDDGGHLKAILPANREGDVLVSHRGLTYGGLIVPRRHLPDYDVDAAIGAVVDWCRINGVRRIEYRPVPHIYHNYPSEADVCAMLRRGAVIESVATSSVIPLHEVRVDNESNRQAAKRAIEAGLRICQTDDCATFYAMLSDCLAQRHQVRPVHTLAELQLLMGRFPDNIRIIAAYRGDDMCGGVMLYVTDTVLHAQYIATTECGRQIGAIPLLVSAINDEYAGSHYRYIDLGTSVEPATGELNRGLSMQKYGLGGRPTLYPRLVLSVQ